MHITLNLTGTGPRAIAARTAMLQYAVTIRPFNRPLSDRVARLAMREALRAHRTRTT